MLIVAVILLSLSLYNRTVSYNDVTKQKEQILKEKEILIQENISLVRARDSARSAYHQSKNNTNLVKEKHENNRKAISDLSFDSLFTYVNQRSGSVQPIR